MATLHRMSEDEMQAMADKLIGMKINKARGYVRRQDPNAGLDMLRVGVGHELLTRYRLPNLGVVVTLVESTRQSSYTDDSQMEVFQKRDKFEPEFLEARVEPLA